MGSSGRVCRFTIGLSFLWVVVAPPRSAVAGVVPCSAADLVNAVQAAVTAGGPQTLDLAAGCTYTLTAVHTGAGGVDATGFPYLNNMTTAPVALTINGNGATITRGSGAPQFRFFLVFPDNTLSLNELTLSGGRAGDNNLAGGGVGGAIVNEGTLSLNSVILSGNRAGDGFNNGGVGFTGGFGGAIYNGGALSAISSTFSNNRGGNGGHGAGGASGGLGGAGGAIANFGTMAITSTLFVSNAGGDGGAPAGMGGSGGAIHTQVDTGVSVIGSAFTSNSAGTDGTGSRARGGAISSPFNQVSGPLMVTLSSFTDNVGTPGSAIYYLGSLTIDRSSVSENEPGAAINSGGGQLSIANATISGNTGGGVALFSGTATLTNVTVASNTGGNISGVVSLRNSIVADSVGAPNCSVPMTNLGNNLDTGTSCGFGSTNGSKSNADAGLGPLQDNGGFTFTHALIEPSDAIDAGDDATCAAAPVNNIDQRGVTRPQGDHCDIGAFETGAAPPTPTPTATATAESTSTPSPTATSTASSGECAGPPEGRVSCWKGEGNTDDSVDGNHGTLVGNTTFVPGIDGQAFRFDGADDGVNLGSPANLKLQNFTIAAWARRSSPSVVSLESNDAVLLSYGLNGYAFGFLGNGRLFLSKAQVNHIDSGPLSVNDTRFHHVAVVQDAGSTVFYIDGVASPSVSYDPGFAFDTDVAIGLRPDISANGFFGDMDEVQIWNRALSPVEIQGIVGTVPPADCDGPQITWIGNGHSLKRFALRRE